MNRVLVHVTQEDIWAGIRGTTHACPIAKAIRRQTGFHARVDSRFWWIPGMGPEKKLPTRATAFVNRYDANKPVEPFNFYLEVPSE